MGRAGSDPGRCRPVGPGDAAGVEEHAEPVVLEGAEPVAGALDLLHAQVETLGRTVRDLRIVPREDVASPPGEGAAQRLDLDGYRGIRSCEPRRWDHRLGAARGTPRRPSAGYLRDREPREHAAAPIQGRPSITSIPSPPQPGPPASTIEVYQRL